ncbi:S1C family serine protease [Priestia koreensis]|uniref:Serine protease n=1 Tax=Priestia koreensis TaxID=284581 RepID=A0A0M0L4J2_9BACI|nr:trypsin-like peptidase domain-containing protein [Priestia koreensis]KOO45944.1 serine protease [Priestia koreensis]
MGYYDDEYQEQRRPRRKRGAFFSGLIGAIIGALIILLVYPALVDRGILPSTSSENDLQQSDNTVAGVQKTVSVNVTSDITKAVSKVDNAVVGVVNIQKSSSFWDSGKSSEAGTGSGVIYKKSGNKAFIATNNHVVEGASEIEVSMSDGTRVKARLLGTDELTDLAVLEIDAKHVKQVATFGNSDSLKRGEPVVAIGNPLGLEFAGSVTQGVVSGTNRAIPQDLNGDGVADWQSEVIQTDAAINPGNSGGALVNIEGDVVGINSMKIAQEEVEGIGLAIPANSVRPVINDLERFGEVRRPYMGISSRSLDEISSYHLSETLKLPKDVVKGVAVIDVEPSSPAAKAGLKQYDVIVELDGKPISNIIDLRKVLYNQKEVGDKLKVTYYRDGKKQTTTMKLIKESL